MPLIVKDFVWDETPKTVGISVPLKGVKKEKIDIFSTDEYIKVTATTIIPIQNLSTINLNAAWLHTQFYISRLAFHLTYLKSSCTTQ